MTDIRDIEAFRQRMAEKNGVAPESDTAGQQQASTAPRRFRLRPATELLNAPARINWLVQDFMQAGTVVVLFGESQAGKSLVALDWAARCVTGTDWNGKKIAQGPVVYIAGEGHAGLPLRLKAWERHFGIALTDDLTVSNIGAQFLSAESVGEVLESLEELPSPPVMVVIDTLAANFGGGNENDTQDMVAFLESVQRIRELFPDVVITIVHHPGHADKTRARGAYALKGAVDTEYRLSVTGEIRELTCTKAKDFEPPATVYLELEPVTLPWIDEYGSPITSPVLALTEKPVEDAVGPLSQQQKRFLKFLSDYIQKCKVFLPDSVNKLTNSPPRGGQWVCPPEGFKDYVVSQGGLSEGTTGDAEKKAFKRCRNALQAKGIIEVCEGYMWLGGQGDTLGGQL